MRDSPLLILVAAIALCGFLDGLNHKDKVQGVAPVTTVSAAHEGCGKDDHHCGCKAPKGHCSWPCATCDGYCPSGCFDCQPTVHRK